MDTHIKQCTGVILAGGENSRMPVRKAFIKVGGEKIIDRNLRVLERLFDEILIVTNEPELYAYTGKKLIGDVYDRRGPMTGLFSALFHAKNKWVFVSACDMPFISGPLIRYMASIRDRQDAVVPCMKGRPEPLCAVYSKRLLPIMEKSLLAGGEGMKVFLHNHKKRVQYISMREIIGTGHGADSFINLNTPGDVDMYLKPDDIHTFKKAVKRRRVCSVSVQRN